MENTLQNFEQILKNQCAKKTPLIYQKKAVNQSKRKPQDVIETVNSQIKAIQLADSVKKCKKNVRNRSSIPSMSYAPVYKEVPKHSKFETQCISDTQLINIIENVEAIDAHKGITQEFDNTFIHTDVKNDATVARTDVSPNTSIQNEELFNHMLEKDRDTTSKENDLIASRFDNNKVNLDNVLISTDNSPEFVSEHNKAAIDTKLIKDEEENSMGNKEFVNNSIELFTENQTQFLETCDSERSPSPVLNPKVRKKRKRSDTPPSFIVPLDVFENFEKTYMPLFNENSDTKVVINSQILGKELCINMDDTQRNKQQLSPIFDVFTEELHVDKRDIKLFENNFQDQKVDTIEHFQDESTDFEVKNLDLNKCKTTIEMIGNLQDEILFSSDEEEYVHKEVEDLPLTCVLETSFYDEPGVLEKTMYVGFQTASNKSIQIQTDSFERAQSIINNSKGFSLTELVDIYDKSLNLTKDTINNPKLNSACGESEQKDNKTDNVESSYDIKDIKSKTEGNQYFGFRTANNTKIKISDRAKAKIHDVFKDIDLNDQIDDPVLTTDDKKPFTNDHIVNEDNLTPIKKINNENDAHYDEKINDDLLIQEFENIEMSLEEIETKNSNEVLFEGFKTASDKKIKISDSVLQNVKNVFQDMELTEINEEFNDTLKLDMDANNRKMAENIVTTDANKEPLNTINNLIIPSTSKSFQGFKTSNNKIINISEASITKTRDVFKDIDSCNIIKDGLSNNNKARSNVKSLETASEKSVKITKEGSASNFNNNENLLHDNCPFNTSHNDLYNKGNNNDNLVFEGFKTASNKIVKVSEQSLVKSRKIFDEIRAEIDTSNCSHYSNKGKDEYTVYKGFQTASNKPVKVSEESLTKSRKIFQNIDSETGLNKTDSFSKSIKDDNAVFKGLQTASNKPVKVSEQSLSKSRKIFQDIDTVTGLNKSDSNSKAIKDDNAVFKGFQTASNKPVKVSEQSLCKSRKIFQDIDTETNLNKTDYYSKAIKDDNAVFKSFQTASNKPVKVSEQSLAKSRKIFESIDTETSNNAPCSLRVKDQNPVFKGFQTASNKPVKVSEQSLAKSRKIFESIDSETSNNTPLSLRVKDQNPVFKGFQTANNKSVEISEKALLESKTVFQEFDEKNIEENSKNNLEENTSFIGFKTANNKAVVISENAFAQSKKVFENLDEPISVSKEIKVDGFKGFQTASNKSVKISKEAIEKTKNIFKDFEDQNTETGHNITSKSKLSCTATERDGNSNNIRNKTTVPNLNLFETASNKKELLNNTSVKTVDTSVNIDNIISTQVMSNFEDNLCTEDFRSEPIRSTSPILSCPRAKKRKFETPYKSLKDKVDTKKDTVQVKKDTYFDKDYKKNKILKLKDLKIIKNKTVDPYITGFNINNILEFKFTKQRNEIIDANLTIDGLKRIFLDGVDEKIIPEGWLDIQIKLVIWKLLSYEVKYNFTCTVGSVLNQLKYRYDKELFKVERSALRKILEKDDVPSKTMILCVADIFVNGESGRNITTTDNIELLLTDGWYFIKATIDKMLSKLVYDKKIFIGCKIATNGAELLNCEQGVSPWEDTSSIRLKLSYNSTRPAHWDARLGYCQSAILSQLSTVKTDGGKICKLRVFITRVYPLLYVEKFEDGSTVTRSERLEYLNQIKYETDREAMLEKIYEEVQKELSDQESQDSESYADANNKRKAYDSGSQIAKMMKKSKDPMEFRAQLTTSQVQLLQDHTSKHRDKMLSIIQDKMRTRLGGRNVVPLARGRIADVKVKGGQTIVSTGMLSIWKPNDAILELFKENSWIEVMNVIPTAVRYSEIQISAGRQSVFSQCKHNVDASLQSHLEKLKRKVYKIEELSKKSIIDNEIDTVGLIFLIDPSNRDFDSTKQFQNVYLADENKNMICINFWGGIKKFGFHNVIDTGQIISCANLQKRAGNTRKNIPQFRVTEFTSITKTPKNSQSREIIDDLNKKLATSREKFCEDCVAVQNNYTALKCFDENSPYFNKSDYNMSKNKQFIETPLRQKDEFNLTGLDFESTFKQTDTQLSPRTLLRKKKVNERIAKLKMYGEPPPLSPINIVNKSKNATSSYKSPLLSNNNDTSVLKNYTRGKKMVEMCNNTVESTSPILNRTYVKRNVNPIKLDFSKTSSVSKEHHFSEDFDASPPLSLE